MIKVLFAIDRMNIGGAPAVVFEQMKSINKEKFDVYLLTLYPSKKANFLTQINFLPQTHFVEFRLKNRSLLDVFTWIKIFRYLKKEKFDIVYTHLFLTNVIIRICAWLARVPVIISTEHSIYSNKRKWQIVIDRLLARITDAIIVAKQEIANFTSKQENINKEKFKVILNPIVLPPKSINKLDYLQKKYRLNKDEFIILTLGRFQEEKGHVYLIEAIDMLKNLPVKCLIVGHGPMQNKLQRIIDKKGLKDKCHLAIEPEQAKLFYYLSDLFVLPSLREGQSLVLFEAMLAKLPVVVSDLPTMREVIKNGQNGLLVEKEKVLALYGAISNVYNNKKLRDRLISGAQETVKKYLAESSVSNLENLFIKLLHDKKI